MLDIKMWWNFGVTRDKLWCTQKNNRPRCGGMES